MKLTASKLIAGARKEAFQEAAAMARAEADLFAEKAATNDQERALFASCYSVAFSISVELRKRADVVSDDTLESGI